MRCHGYPDSILWIRLSHRYNHARITPQPAHYLGDLPFTGNLSSLLPLPITTSYKKQSPQRWTLWDTDVNLADIQVPKLNPQTSHEYEFESPPLDPDPED